MGLRSAERQAGQQGQPHAPLHAQGTGTAEGRAFPGVHALGRVLQAGTEEGSRNKSHQEGPVPTSRASRSGDREAGLLSRGASVAALTLIAKICWGKNRQCAGLFRRLLSGSSSSRTNCTEQV